VTAARLLQAKQTIPHFYLEADCRVDGLMALRRQLNARNDGLKITITDLVVLAAARALRKVPVANSAWAETVVRVFENVDIAVAVSTSRGLLTPIVRSAHRKGLAAISRELKELADRARRGQLQPSEYTGGTFTISNLGMFGVTGMTPIINPPQSCILGVGSIEARAVVADGQLTAGHMMRCTLAADHRAIDGVEGAGLLSEIRRLLENPVAMALEA
jgi:pyruvate dehydrogenase E2 component (dihydrolipoamide acetyltransferase)